MSEKTYVYIDGFNLFYGCLKGTEFKWLDIQKLCQLYVPNNNIQKIYFFTAPVRGTAKDPDKPQRQMAYLRALATLPIVQVIHGHFISEDIELPLSDGSGVARVRRLKEKRSDVNLVSQLLWDAHCDRFKVAVIVSGDSDFITPISLIKVQFAKHIGVLDPQRNGTPNSPMNKLASFYKPIRPGALQACQFPDHMSDDRGPFQNQVIGGQATFDGKVANCTAFSDGIELWLNQSLFDKTTAVVLPNHAKHSQV